MRVPLPDGSVRELPDGSTGADLAADIGPGLARAAMAIRVLDGDKTEKRDGAAYDDGRIVDLSLPLVDGRPVEIVTAKAGDGDALKLLRHDIAHVLAESVLELYPGTKVSIGPPIADGFYYDFEFPAGVSINEDDFPKIEAQMRKHVKADEPFVRSELPAGEAIEHFLREDQPYKVELIEDLVKNQGVPSVGIYQNGDFYDLCRGPHAPGTGRAKAFKLTSVAGAYWRGDANRQMLTRIYGTAFATKEELAEHMERLEQARARDHRKLGKELELFMFSELSPGSPFWMPNGMAIWNELTKLWREENSARGYSEVHTPILYDAELFKRSGHWHVYRDNMYFTDVEGQSMGLKPMNCPAHTQLYASSRRSYRDLPIRYSEQGLVHRHEPSGTLHGLLRVRHITQDDAHIFATEDQIEEEVIRALEFGFAIYERFGFEPRLELSTRPEKRIGTEEMWDKAEAALQKALDNRGLAYEVNEGDGAFYGPKIDLHMTDAIGRSWQLGTVQLDYVMPERFDLTYTGADNAEHRPVMIHRALMGSFERFIGMLIEHYAGEFPVWLAPVQAIVLPVSDRHVEHADRIQRELGEFRVEVDRRTESIGRKIRDAELRKIPYMLVLGDREAESGTLSVRRHREGDQGALSLEDLRAKLVAGE
jgi:threonyl-tRNA synthetase